MPDEFWTDAARMATSGLLVAVVALPAGLLARALRPRGEPLLPRWKPWRVPWGGVEVIFAFVVIALLLPFFTVQLLEGFGFYPAVYGPDFPASDAKGGDPGQVKEANTLRMLWANLFALPAMLGLLWLTRAGYSRRPEFVGRGSLAGKVWLAVAAWFAVTPVVLVLNAVVNAVSQSLGVPPEEHALTKLGHRPPVDQVIFALEACIDAPLREEILFRGILLPWCVGRTRIPGAGVSAVTAWRPWFVMVAAVAFAAVFGQGNVAPLVFALLLAAGLAAVWFLKRTGARRARAVYATAAFFAVVHSSVWPNPVPLFVLGLALGWLAARTNGILVPVIVHGLFNAVSAVFVLRG